jgi:hypothetical protein
MSAVDVYMAVVNLKPRLQLTFTLFKFLSQEKQRKNGAGEEPKKKSAEIVVPGLSVIKLFCP